jgi:selenocysteine lyase/cysteine desulfurase
MRRRGARVTFEEARSLFPVLGTIAYLNAGTFGPLPRPVADALAAGVEQDLALGRSGLPSFEETMGYRAELRGTLAGLVGAEPEQVALTSSTTEGCAIVLRGLDLRPEDEIVTTTDEHFGLLGPVAASGARVVLAEPDAERIVEAVTPRTRLIAASQVLWTTGAVVPLAEIRARTGVPVLADGAQSVGAIPTTAAGVDFLTISGQKWLCGPDSTGALVAAEPERLRVVSPGHFSQRRYERDGTYEPQPGARRLETGWWSRGTVRAMLAALAIRPDWGFERARQAAERCRAALAERAEVITPAERGTLVSFRVEEDPVALVARLHESGVVVREIPGRGIVRVSCGWWTSDEDVDRLVAAL